MLFSDSEQEIAPEEYTETEPEVEHAIVLEVEYGDNYANCDGTYVMDVETILNDKPIYLNEEKGRFIGWSPHDGWVLTATHYLDEILDNQGRFGGFHADLESPDDSIGPLYIPGYHITVLDLNDAGVVYEEPDSEPGIEIEIEHEPHQECEEYEETELQPQSESEDFDEAELLSESEDLDETEFNPQTQPETEIRPLVEPE